MKIALLTDVDLSMKKLTIYLSGSQVIISIFLLIPGY